MGYGQVIGIIQGNKCMRFYEVTSLRASLFTHYANYHSLSCLTKRGSFFTCLHMRDADINVCFPWVLRRHLKGLHQILISKPRDSIGHTNYWWMGLATSEYAYVFPHSLFWYTKLYDITSKRHTIIAMSDWTSSGKFKWTFEQTFCAGIEYTIICNTYSCFPSFINHRFYLCISDYFCQHTTHTTHRIKHHGTLFHPLVCYYIMKTISS